MTTGKIERFHRTLRSEFLTGRTFPDLETAQAELDAWVRSYNTERPHQALAMATPAERFIATAAERPADNSAIGTERQGEDDAPSSRPSPASSTPMRRSSRCGGRFLTSLPPSSYRAGCCALR
jgi:hypothetical protein